jgi:hypothetical protein
VGMDTLDLGPQYDAARRECVPAYPIHGRHSWWLSPDKGRIDAAPVYVGRPARAGHGYGANQSASTSVRTGGALLGLSRFHTPRCVSIEKN